MSQILFVCLELIFAHFTYLTECSSSLPQAPALYVFGDSLLDSGNNNWLPTLAKANYPPYGHNFPQGPTGRFTNGKMVADFVVFSKQNLEVDKVSHVRRVVLQYIYPASDPMLIREIKLVYAAEALGLPYPPPYVALFRQDSITGYNYASGACGILPETGDDSGVCLNLDEQVRLFEQTVKTHLASRLKKSNQLDQHLAKSILIFSVGNNDYIGNYFRTSSRTNYNPRQFAQLLVDAFSLKLQKLHSLGARIGCIPSIVKGAKSNNGQCDENKNQIVSLFNNKLAVMMNNLTSTLQDSHFIVGRANELGYDSIINPANYGLSDSRNPCCVTWGNGTLSCIPGIEPCEDPNKHYFWDGYHLTQAICSLVASRCINGSDVCFPLNIQQLVQQ